MVKEDHCYRKDKWSFHTHIGEFSWKFNDIWSTSSRKKEGWKSQPKIKVFTFKASSDSKDLKKKTWPWLQGNSENF